MSLRHLRTPGHFHLHCPQLEHDRGQTLSYRIVNIRGHAGTLLFQHFFAQLPFGMFLMGNISQRCDGSHNPAGHIVDRARVEDEVAATPA